MAVVAPAVMNIGGYETEVVSLVLSILTVVAVRLLFGFRRNSSKRDEAVRTVLAAILVFAYNLNYHPGPGTATVIAAGIGMSIATLLDIFGAFVTEATRRILGIQPPTNPPGD